MSTLLEQLAKCKGAKFASLVYVAPAEMNKAKTKISGPRMTPETARHIVILGAEITALYERDLQVLKEITPTLPSNLLEAAERVRLSREMSVARGVGNNPAYTCAGVYSETGVTGVKIHNGTGELYVRALSIRKDVITAAVYRAVDSSQETLDNNAVKALLPSVRYRQFTLSGVKVAKLNGETLVLE